MHPPPPWTQTFKIYYMLPLLRSYTCFFGGKCFAPELNVLLPVLYLASIFLNVLNFLYATVYFSQQRINSAMFLR
jgi:hypothetical protein